MLSPRPHHHYRPQPQYARRSPKMLNALAHLPNLAQSTNKNLKTITRNLAQIFLITIIRPNPSPQTPPKPCQSPTPATAVPCSSRAQRSLTHSAVQCHSVPQFLMYIAATATARDYSQKAKAAGLGKADRGGRARELARAEARGRGPLFQWIIPVMRRRTMDGLLGFGSRSGSPRCGDSGFRRGGAQKRVKQQAEGRAKSQAPGKNPKIELSLRLWVMCPVSPPSGQGLNYVVIISRCAWLGVACDVMWVRVCVRFSFLAHSTLAIYLRSGPAPPGMQHRACSARSRSILGRHVADARARKHAMCASCKPHGTALPTTPHSP